MLATREQDKEEDISTREQFVALISLDEMLMRAKNFWLRFLCSNNNNNLINYIISSNSQELVK